MTDAASIDAFLSQEEAVLKAAVAQTMTDYHTDRSTDNLRRWDVAKKALAAFRAQQETGSSFATQELARDYLLRQGFPCSAGKLSMDTGSGIIGRAVVNGKKVYTQKALDRYAQGHLKKTAVDAPDDHRARLIKEQADKLALNNEITRGAYLLKSEEEQRDARVLAGIKQAVLNFGPFVIGDLLTLAGSLIGDDAAHKLGRLSPELLARYDDHAQELFDRFAKAGEL